MENDSISRRVFAARCLRASALPLLLCQPGVVALTGAVPPSQPAKPWMVSTMTGLVRCDSLGTTLMHEHVLWFGGPRLEDPGYTPIPTDKRQESVDFAVSLLNAAARAGKAHEEWAELKPPRRSTGKDLLHKKRSPLFSSV